MRRAPDVTLSPAERSVLEQWAVAQGSSKRLAARAQIVLEAAGGRTNGEIARLLGIHSETVGRWRNRFIVNRVDGLYREAPRSGRRSTHSPALVARILHMTLEEAPAQGTRWTTRSLARALQVNHMRIHRVWRSHGLAGPGLAVRSSSASSTPTVDVAGVYLGAPAAAIIFSVESPEARSEPATVPPALPTGISAGYLLPEVGTIPSTLVDTLTGAEEFLTRVADARRAPHELLVFLRTIEESSAPDAQLHIILDRPLGFLSDRVGQWIASHPRFRVYQTSPSESWTASVDEWLRTWQGPQLAPGSFRAVANFTEAISLAAAGERRVRRPFSWTRSAGIRDPGRRSGDLPAPGANSPEVTAPLARPRPRGTSLPPPEPPPPSS